MYRVAIQNVGGNIVSSDIVVDLDDEADVVNTVVRSLAEYFNVEEIMTKSSGDGEYVIYHYYVLTGSFTVQRL